MGFGAWAFGFWVKVEAEKELQMQLEADADLVSLQAALEARFKKGGWSVLTGLCWGLETQLLFDKK